MIKQKIVSCPIEICTEDKRNLPGLHWYHIYHCPDKLVVYYSFTCKCSNVTPSVERLGDLLISDHCIHFVSDDAVRDFQTNLQVNYQVKVIVIIWYEIWQLQSYLIVHNKLSRNIMCCSVKPWLAVYWSLWNRELIGNLNFAIARIIQF